MPGDLFSVVARVCDPKNVGKCCECGRPATFGEPTCGREACRESLQRAMFGPRPSHVTVVDTDEGEVELEDPTDMVAPI